MEAGGTTVRRKEVRRAELVLGTPAFFGWERTVVRVHVDAALLQPSLHETSLALESAEESGAAAGKKHCSVWRLMDHFAIGAGPSKLVVDACRVAVRPRDAVHGAEAKSRSGGIVL